MLERRSKEIVLKNRLQISSSIFTILEGRRAGVGTRKKNVRCEC